MSDVKSNDLRRINHIDDIMETYTGVGNDAMTGIEVELAFFDPKSPDLTPMSIPQNKVVKNATNTACSGEFVRNEPTSEMLEVGSKPGKPDSLKEIIEDTDQKIACLTEKAANIGLKRSYFQDLPNITAAQLLQNIVDIERYQAFFAPPREDMKEIAAYFSVCKSNQVSVSYTDPEHLLSNIRRLYALTPVLFMLTDNGSGFNEGQKFNGHAGMNHRAALKDKGGMPSHLFTAKNGQDYILSHIDNVKNNPLFVYYDADGNLVRLPSGTWESFNSLKEKGLNTATNYYFSESILWPDVKIAAIKNAQEEVFAHRYEARMFGVGIHQHSSALLITAGLAFNPLFADKTDRLLKTFGFDWKDPDTTQKHPTAAYENARNHNGAFLDIAYGTGQMIEFTKEFANIIEETYAGSELEHYAEPICTIARTGCTDAKINRHLFPTLQNAIEFQRTYDPGVFTQSTTCARTLFTKELAIKKKQQLRCYA